ncbi:MAG: DUF6638 family protein, partial [Verrucomicrobiota bacterium]
MATKSTRKKTAGAKKASRKKASGRRSSRYEKVGGEDHGPVDFLLTAANEEGALAPPPLVAVDTPKLVKRYNECLTEMGIGPTKLKTFRVDGMGWSPEIAAEKNRPDYLSAGVANPMAILVSPDQCRKPVCFPFHSFDEQLMNRYTSKFRDQVADITVNRGIGIDIDQDLIRYESPRDLLLVDYIVVRSHAGHLEDIADYQAALVKRMLEDDLAWFDRDFRVQLLESAKQHGDLRFRNLSIPDLCYHAFRSYYTRAFGGVFVLRDARGRHDLLVTQDPAHVREGAPGVYSVDDPDLLDRLVEE